MVQIEKFLEITGLKIPQVSTQLKLKDKLNNFLVRWDFGRKRYTIEPGLYAIGYPDENSPVLVSANYKLSFDMLRKELSGLNVFILVLDTKGINVWCAAGKGTFGTKELTGRIISEHLSKIIAHKNLILPQLGAPGVSAHLVTMATQFKVIYGPVYAKDLPAFLNQGMVKTDEMRHVDFKLHERLAVAPVELVHAWPFFLGAIAVSVLLSFPADSGFLTRILRYSIIYAGSIFAGSIIFPALLPYLPFQAFALKGAVLGFLWAIGFSLLFGFSVPGILTSILICAPLVSFIAMNFTGASTYTCQTGAQLEVKAGLPIMAVSAVLGIGLTVSRFFLHF